MTKFAKLILFTLIAMAVGSIVFLVFITNFNDEKKIPAPRYLDQSNIEGETVELQLVETDNYKYYTSVLPNEENIIKLDETGYIQVNYDAVSVETYQYSVFETITNATTGFYSEDIKENTSEEITLRNSTCNNSKLVVQDALGYENTTVFLTCPVDDGVLSINYSKNTLGEHPLDTVYTEVINTIH